MKILITGAFGNIGFHAVQQALNRGHIVRCFDVNTPVNAKRAKKIAKHVEIMWGDLRKPESVEKAVEDMDAILHIAAIIPPLSERNPKLAHDVNTVGTKNIIDAIKKLPKEPRFVFTSSISVFGHTQDITPPRRVTDPLNPTDHYSKTKVECEGLIQGALQLWTICRLAAAAPVELKSFDPIMFEIPLNTRIEFIYPGDVARALLNAIDIPQSIGKIFLIGGGPSCQMYYRDYVGRLLDAFGVGHLPEKAFQTQGEFYTDWLDTSESQHILQYQTMSFESYAAEVSKKLGFLHIIIEMLRDFIKIWILGKSRYMKAPASAKSTI